MNTSTDRIERKVLLKAPRARVWRALSDAAEFGSWFGVDFKGKSFVAGKQVRGMVTYPGFEHVTMEITIERVVPERLLSWRWHPAAIDPKSGLLARTHDTGRFRIAGSRRRHDAHRGRVWIG